MKRHDYTIPAEISRKLYELGRSLRLKDDNRCIASDVAEELDSIRRDLDSYISSDNNEVDDPEDSAPMKKAALLARAYMAVAEADLSLDDIKKIQLPLTNVDYIRLKKARHSTAAPYAEWPDAIRYAYLDMYYEENNLCDWE